MTSELQHTGGAYVWVWLPQQSEPVVAGRIVKQGQLHHFTYGRSYRERDDAIALSPFELPLRSGAFQPEGLNTIHSCLRDAAPDAWGRRVISYQHAGFTPDELDYLLLSGSDRIGALDFQRSGAEYQPRQTPQASLQELLLAAEMIDQGKPLPPELDIALRHGTSVGGARPKALINADTHSYIAKFSTSTDQYDIVKAEYVAMQLAKQVGLSVADTQLASAMGKDVLLVERFDRFHQANRTHRRLLLSGLSLLGLNEMEARYASYRDLADLIRQRFADPTATLHELFQRLVFNILIGNTDDHARNHAAFWDGETLQLTPAYDLCPQLRAGREATQAMQIGGSQGNFSTLENALSVCHVFQLTKEAAQDKIGQQVATIRQNWEASCEAAGMGEMERKRLWQRAVFNPFCFGE
ncbi:MAG: type II toxin-antitoxin system HipA family toxin [Gammaproteobacteria bacterium]|nr:type II toxin-antitoxin system HipA family toxin [Gammaproteobacteria bacterium]MBU2005593.1 type II toxin-antitoxin system HipA family toxin [Gammaproteobacteria bacterium]